MALTSLNLFLLPVIKLSSVGDMVLLYYYGLLPESCVKLDGTGEVLREKQFEPVSPASKHIYLFLLVHCRQQNSRHEDD